MNKQELKEFLSKRLIPYTECQINSMFSFMKKTLETNEKFNLTAIKDEETFIEKMIADSALGLIELDISNKKIIDVGTGAGYPGMIIYLLNPTCDMTLLDSTQKKINYIKEYSKENNYHLDFVCDRCEDFAKKNIEQYDYAFARAVAPLNILLELIIPLLKVGGTFVAYKGKEAVKEINDSKKALEKLNCHIEKIYDDELPISKEERKIIYIKKDRTNRNIYPRPYKDIKNRPL